MNIPQLVEDLKQNNVDLWEEQGAIRFRGPKEVITSAIRTSLSNSKPEVLAYLRDRDSELPAVEHDSEQLYQPFPVTDLQGAYIVGRGDTYDMGNIGCHSYFELRFPELDIQRLNNAWQQLIERHHMLRTRFFINGTQQIFENTPSYVIEEFNLRGAGEKTVEKELGAIREQMSHHVFNIETWPLFELRVTRGNEWAILHISIDLLIADYMSIEILMQELGALYNNPEEELPQLDITFRAYLLTEKKIEQTKYYEKSRDYWLKRLDNFPIAPQLPTARSMAEIARPNFSRKNVRIDSRVWDRFQKNASVSAVTASSALIAAYGEILSRWSSQSHFGINMTVLNRLSLHPNVTNLVGDFTGVNLLEFKGGGGESFRKRAQNLQVQVWEDMDNRYFSGIQVMRELSRKKGREEALMPIVYTSMIGVGDFEDTSLSLMNTGKFIYGISQTPQVWLDCQLMEYKGGLEINWDFVEDFFPEGLIDDMFDAYCKLLVRLGEDISEWNKTTQLQLPENQLKIRQNVNATKHDLPQIMLHTLFEQQAMTQPEKTAIITPQLELSYGALSALSGSVARLLEKEGVTPNTLVAVVMEKGWEQIVSVLGILKSGAAYLPIDSGIPGKRLQHILRDAEAGIVLTQSWLKKKLEWPENLRIFPVDTIEPDENNPEESRSVQTPQDLAYVIYTSGSTGQPKGVMINHISAVNTILAVNRRYGISSADRVLSLSSLSFDLSVYDIFGLLAAGGTIILPNAGQSRNPAHWADLIERHRVTVWNSVPALLQMLVTYAESAKGAGLDSLHTALLSGDWIPLDLPEKVMKLNSDIKLTGLGGATEASIWSILYPIETVDTNWKSIPYGKPMDNQSFHVLNDAMEDCPTWVPGRLYIGGVGLAKGYWRDPERTNKSFISHPRTGEALYYTGDLGRYLPDGNIEFLGRDDFQVKIRGYRVELSEIEKTLNEHSAVSQAVAVTVGEPMGDKRIIAYVLPEEDGGGDLNKNAGDKGEDLEWGAVVDAGTKQVLQQSGAIDHDEMVSFYHALDRFALINMCRAIHDFNVFGQTGDAFSPDELMDSCKIASKNRNLFYRWLTTLHKEGLLQAVGNGKYAKLKNYTKDERQDAWERLEKAHLDFDSGDVTINYFKQSCDKLKELLLDEADPLALFFPGGSQETAMAAYNTNFSSRFMNGVVVALIRAILEKAASNKTMRILEIGAGVGGTTTNLVPAIADKDIEYTFTDLSHYFLNAAKEQFKDYSFMKFDLFDINTPPVQQGYMQNSFDIILSANVLHNSHEVDQTLGFLKSMLVPGGFLVIVEATTDSYPLMASMEFKTGLESFKDEYRLKNNTPFLSKELWRSALLNAGARVSVFPETTGDLDVIGQHVMVARFSAPTTRLDKEELFSLLHSKLPAYMVPSNVVFIDNLPLTNSGKVDRNALIDLRSPTKDEPKRQTKASVTEYEKRLVEIWKQILNLDGIGIHDNFYEAGGDSLLVTQLIAKVRESFGEELIDWDRTLHHILNHPTIASLSKYIEEEDNKRGQKDEVFI